VLIQALLLLLLLLLLLCLGLTILRSWVLIFK
jgi:hypothetical protein